MAAAIGAHHRAAPPLLAAASAAVPSSSSCLECCAWFGSRSSHASAGSTSRSRLFFDDVGPTEAEPSCLRSQPYPASVGEPSRPRQEDVVHIAPYGSATSRPQCPPFESSHKGRADGQLEEASAAISGYDDDDDRGVSFSAAPAGDAATISLAIAAARTLRDVESVLRQYGRLFRSQHVVQLLAVLPAVEVQGVNAGPRLTQIIRCGESVDVGWDCFSPCSKCGQGISRKREAAVLCTLFHPRPDGPPHTNAHLYSLMCQGLMDTVSELDGPAIATCLWALGRLGQAPPGAVHILLEELLAGSATKMQHCSFPQLADVAWSMAKLQVGPPGSQLCGGVPYGRAAGASVPH